MAEEKSMLTGVPQNAVFNLTQRDKDILSTKDEDYHLQTWEDLKIIISNNALWELTRLPSQLRAYIAWNAEQKAIYGNITNFILQKRLYWEAEPGSVESGNPTFVHRSSVPFGDRADYRILINDWPYGLAPGIVHLCVWLKVRLPTNERDGDLTPEGREMGADYVFETFEKGLGVEGEDKILWFKNWTGLQSVRGLEHIHVLVRDVEKEKLDKIIEKPGEERAK